MSRATTTRLTASAPSASSATKRAKAAPMRPHCSASIWSG